MRVLLLLSLIALVYGGIITIPAGVSLKLDDLVWASSGVYALGDTPAGTGIPSVSYSLSVQQLTNGSTGTSTSPTADFAAEIVVFHSSRAFEVGSNIDSDHCCTELRQLAGECTTIGRLLLNPNTGGSNNTLNYNVVPLNYTSTHVSLDIVPEVSGIWFIYMFNCDQNNRQYSVTGTLTWKSPYGYLPAQSFGNMIVYFVVAFLYFVLLILWIVWLVRFHDQLQPYQHAVTVLIVVSVADELLWGGQHTEYNILGYPTLGILIPAVLVFAVKLTIIRLLLLLMGLGYAITQPSVPAPAKMGATILSVIYLIVSATDSYIQVSELFTNSIPAAIVWLTGALLVIVNIVFIIWIVISSYRTMKTCVDDKKDKHGMYKRLMIIFGSICVISVIFFLVQFGLDVADYVSATFRVWWLLDTYWEFIYFIITVYIAYVWRPSEDNTRYAYEVLGEDDNIPMPNLSPQAESNEKKED